MSGLSSESRIVELARATTYTSTADAASYTATARGIGTASSTRRVVVAFSAEGGANANTVTSITIGGISATIRNQVFHDSGQGFSHSLTAIADAVVPTGTTADVVVNINNTCACASISTVSINNSLNSGVYSTAGVTHPGSALMSTTVATPINGFLISIRHGTLGSQTYTWTNATEWEDVAMTNEMSFSTAIFRPQQETNWTVSSTGSSTSVGMSMCTAVYQ